MASETAPGYRGAPARTPSRSIARAFGINRAGASSAPRTREALRDDAGKFRKAAWGKQSRGAPNAG